MFKFSRYSTNLKYNPESYNQSIVDLQGLLRPYKGEEHNLKNYYSNILFVCAPYKCFRLIFLLPARGQRTWSNGKTSKKQPTYIYNYKYSVFTRFFKKTSKNIFFAEYVNLLWQIYWHIDWKKLNTANKRIPFFVSRKKYISVADITDFNITNFKKQKKQKKRVTVGFPFGFTKKYHDKLL